MHKDLNKSVNYHLEPGYVYVNGSGGVIRTVVGSCVAVVLWDSKIRVGGMNHYIYAHTTKHDKATTRFGNVALPALFRMMHREFGCRASDIHAQIIGGASPLQFTSKTGGIDNIKVARKYLHRAGIRIVSEDTGGYMGRKVLFDTATGQVAIIKVQQLRREDWVKVIR